MSRRITTSVLTGAALVLTLIASAVPAQATEDAKPPRLGDYKPQFHPAPGAAGHKYRFTTTTGFWSVVATSPNSTLDTDLRLYGDKGQDELLGSSLASTGVTDFVAIDSNHRALDRYFPRVDTHSGSGNYDVQLAQGDDALGLATQVVDMNNDEIVAVRDTFLEAGETYRFTLTPNKALMDADLFLMDSLPLSPATWVRSRAQSVDSASAPAGSPVVMEFTAPRDDVYGLVIIRQGVFGTYDLVKTEL